MEHSLLVNGKMVKDMEKQSLQSQKTQHLGNGKPISSSKITETCLNYFMYEFIY